MWVSGGGTAMTMTPNVTVDLHSSTSPFALVESQTATLNTAGVGTFNFTSPVNGTSYYLGVKSANTVETWSASAQSFTAGALSYDFTSGVGQAYQLSGGTIPPLAFHSPKYCIYSGDCNQDGYVTSDDFTGVDNDISHNTFHAVYDVNGNGYITSDDFTYIDNNATKGVQSQKPPVTGSTTKPIVKHFVQKDISGK
jgi:hypothetical protein